MHLLYGVVGEGMGHATRSRVVIEHLLSQGHRLRVVVSGRAERFLADVFRDRDGIDVHGIEGFSLAIDGEGIDLSETILQNLELMPARLRRNLVTYSQIVDTGFAPDAVISDFESWAWCYGVNHRLPVISIDNMHVLDRCEHPDRIAERDDPDFLLAKAAVKVKLPGAYHYLVTSFFFPPVRKRRTTLVPPILRPQVVDAQREPGEHVLVYQTAASNKRLVPLLKRLPGTFRVYGMDRKGDDGNVTFRPFSEVGFLDDLRTARAAIATGGFTLMSEAVHLGVPLLAVPLDGQFEQELNCRWLARLGYGRWTPSLEEDGVRRFLEDVPRFAEALREYPRQGNGLVLSCLDELLDCVAADLDPPDRLQTEALGTWEE